MSNEPGRCKFCGSKDWQNLGLNPMEMAYKWLCRYCGKVTTIGQVEMVGKRYGR